MTPESWQINSATSAAAPGAERKASPGPTLGQTMVKSREARGLKQDAAAADSKIPLMYLRMIEADDYGLIADQLYLLPFLRRYADYLGLDGEEIGMRFVRDVQRADL